MRQPATLAGWKAAAKRWRRRALAAEAALDFEYGGHVCQPGRACHHEPTPSRSFAELMASWGASDAVPGVSVEVVYGSGLPAGGSR